MTRRLLAPAVLLLVLAAPLLAAGCSSDTTSKAKDTVSSAKDDAKVDADKAAARTAAEALRASLKANKTADKEGIRSTKAINEAAADLPGDAKFSGVADSNSDGQDDDGKVQVDVGDQHACLTLPATGKNIDVTSGAC